MADTRTSGPRPVAGRARYATPPEIGTIVGPKDITREHLAVIGHDGPWTLFGYATSHELTAARDRLVQGEAPRSMAERAWLHG